MRITKVSIGSFGGLRDRSFNVSPGLTVFHGPNESGKTTTMEFIRSALVPTRKRTYPARDKGDFGSLTYTDGDGEHIIDMDGRERSGDIPAMPAGTDDPDMYRSVFAMDARGLDDDAVVGGEIRSRFLTVPGGEMMPQARDALERDANDSIGKTSRSPSRVNDLSGKIEGNDRNVAEARREVDRYGELSGRRAELEAELSGLRKASQASQEDRRVHDLYVSQKGNYDSLEKLNSELASLGGFQEVTDDDAEEHGRLVSDLAKKRAAQEALEGQRDVLTRDLAGADRRAVMAAAARIDALPGRLETYRKEKSRLSGMPAVGPRKVTKEVRRTNPLVYVGAVLAVMGLIGCMLSTYFIALTAVGAVIAAVGVMRPKTGTVTTTETTGDDGRSELEASVAAFESDVAGLMSSLSLQSAGVEEDVSRLTGIRAAAGSITRMETDLMKAQLARKDAEIALARFESRFGGAEGFDGCSAKTSRARGIKSRISTVRGAISASGLDPDVPICPVEYAETDSGEMLRVSSEIGRIEQEMRAILDTEEVERLMDLGESLRSELSDALTDGAVALLAVSIADDACDDIYSTVQPGVIATADRYLGLMTGGAYSIDTNPLSRDLSVRSGNTVKGMQMWSSGLRAQVLLSVKLAVAREMGGGEVPVILDDVLLPFDSERKEGACRALAELSSEMQVLMFTCDSETARICRGLQGATVIEM